MTTQARCLAAIAAVILAAALARPVQAERAAEVSRGALYAAGLADYEDGRYAESLTAFTKAAHAGHLRSQEIAGLMNLLGPRVYGEAAAEDRGAALRWFARAAEQGSAMGTRMARRLSAVEVAVERKP